LLNTNFHPYLTYSPAGYPTDKPDIVINVASLLLNVTCHQRNGIGVFLIGLVIFLDSWLLCVQWFSKYFIVFDILNWIACSIIAMIGFKQDFLTLCMNR